MIRYILAIMLLLPLVSQGQIISSAAIMELQNMDYSAPCAACSAWRYSRTDAKLYRWSGTAWNEVDLPLNNEIQTLSVSNDTIFLSNGGFVKVPAATVSGVQGTISYWASPQSFGSLFIGDGLGRDGDTLLVTQVLDSTRLIQDSILVYYQDSLEVGRDTINIPQVAFDNYTIKGPPYRVDTSIIVSHVQLTNYSLDPKINSAWFASDLDTLTDEARLEYNATYGTLQFGMDRNVPVEIGQALYNEPVVNKTGVTLVKGTLLMVDTSQFTQGNRLRVMPANALLPPDLIVGIAAENIGINAEGYVLWFGQLQASLTLLQPVGETWVAGDILYPHPTINGRLTKVLPTNGFLKTPVAVIKTINGSNVIFKVRIKIGEYLRNITDVEITSPANGSLLMYNNGLWTDSLTTFLDSITFSVPNYMTVSPTTLNNSGTVTLGFGNQSSNTVFAGPTTPGSGQPTFRTLAAADLHIAGGITGSGSYQRIPFYTTANTISSSTGMLFNELIESFTLGTGLTNTSSLLTLNSTNKGILLPRLTTTQRNTITPINSLLLYNTTNKGLEIYDTTWTNWLSVPKVTFQSVNGVLVSGNTGEIASSAALQFDESNAFLGINTITPAYSLHIEANDAIKLPVGDNTTTPSPTRGLLRYETGVELLRHANSARWMTIPSYRDAAQNGNILQYNGSEWALTTISGSTPAGSTGLIQFNNNNTFSASSNLFWDITDSELGVGTTTPAARIHAVGSGTTSAADGLLIEDSAARDLLVVDNAGRIEIAQNTTVTTQNTAVITNTTANSSLVIAPNGNGALIADIPDGAVAGGNARGSNAVDLQTTRAAATQVASGSASTVIGGIENTASGQFSVAGGESNIAGARSAVAFGRGHNITGNYGAATGNSNEVTAPFGTAIGQQSIAYLLGQFAISGGVFTARGDSQFSQFGMSRSITGKSQSELFLSSSSSKAVLPTNRVWNANVQCSAVVNDAGNGTSAVGSAIVQTFDLGIKRIGNTTSLIGTVVAGLNMADTGMAGAAFTVDADDTDTTGEALRIRFTPATNAGTTTVTRCHCVVKLSEVGY